MILWDLDVNGDGLQNEAVQGLSPQAPLDLSKMTMSGFTMLSISFISPCRIPSTYMDLWMSDLPGVL
ncbi:hypothetical protein WISP_15307 [Willisornis vidua]|uniref:Uncharacterized protein n=1 Tax=Willisornis vidua TaxID=1566151 RepID=A0ABQ9DVX3_9PASS|nr:hypothetical protein WISP_15307 [Willisornis vidua]